MKIAIIIGITMISFCNFGQTNVKLFSWNIKMLPKICKLISQEDDIISDEIRLEKIIVTLRKSNANIIQLQEVFEHEVYQKIFDSLKLIYPFAIFPKKKFLKFSNGLMVLSKYPIKIEKTIFFDKGRLSDFFASKGAVLYSCMIEDQKTYLINTHLQSDYKYITSEVLRQEQMSQINNELIQYISSKNSPIILAGDFNFDEHSMEYTHSSQDYQWDDMTKTGENPRYTFSSDNYWNKDQPNEKLDYVFTKNSKNSIISHNFEIITSNKIGDIDVSDHYPIQFNMTLIQDKIISENISMNYNLSEKN